jgi:hypothetical protein
LKFPARNVIERMRQDTGGGIGPVDKIWDGRVVHGGAVARGERWRGARPRMGITQR